MKTPPLVNTPPVPPLQVAAWSCRLLLSQPVGMLIPGLAIGCSQFLLGISLAPLWAGPAVSIPAVLGLALAGVLASSCLVWGAAAAAISALHRPQYEKQQSTGGRRRWLWEVLMAAPLRGATLGMARLPAVGTVGLITGAGLAASALCLVLLLVPNAEQLRALSGSGMARGASAGQVVAGLLGLLGLLASHALGTLALLSGLLAAARISAADSPGATPMDGLLAQGRAVADLLRSPARAGSLAAALMLANTPLLLGCLLALPVALGEGPLPLRLSMLAVIALCLGVCMLWLATGLRLGLHDPGPLVRKQESS